MSRRPSPHDLLHHLTVALSGVATSFKRVRRWSPRSVTVMLLTRPDVRSSYATVLTDLAQESCRALGVVAATTKSSLSVARKKVSVAVFRQVLHQLADHFCPLLPGRFSVITPIVGSLRWMLPAWSVRERLIGEVHSTISRRSPPPSGSGRDGRAVDKVPAPAACRGARSRC